MIRIVLKKTDRSLRVVNDAPVGISLKQTTNKIDVHSPTVTNVQVREFNNLLRLLQPKQQTVVIKRSQVGPQGPPGPKGDKGDKGDPGSGGAGSTLKAYVDPLEAPNNTRTVFTVPDTFIPQSLAVYLNGLQEYNIVELGTNQFEFSTAPLLFDIVKLVYNS